MKLLPISEEDLPTLTRIHDDAFAHDPLMQLMYGLPDAKTNLEDDLRLILHTVPSARFTKAIDEATGDIIGWSWWSLYLDGQAREADSAAAEAHAQTVPSTARSPRLYLDFHREVNLRRREWATGPANGRSYLSKTSSMMFSTSFCLIVAYL